MDSLLFSSFTLRGETDQNVGGLSAISLGGPTGWSTGKRDDQGRDDLPALYSPHILDGLVHNDMRRS